MKNDDLERLEESQEMQQLIRLTKEQYKQEKAKHTPTPFSSVMQTIREKQNHKRSLRISPWWLTAACLLGCVIGYGISSGSEIQPEKLAVTDTVVVIHERVDTIYREVKPRPLIAAKSVSKPTPTEKPVIRTVKTTEKTEVDFVSPGFMQPQLNMPDPESDCYAANGMSIAEDNYPLHLLMAVQGK